MRPRCGATSRKGPGAQRLAAVCRATQASFRGPWAELAAGAGAPLNDLALLNFRGDLGIFAWDTADDGTGCNDLAWRRELSFIAHNEDQAAFFAGRCMLLTQDLDGWQPVTVFAAPGFLPSNAFTVTGSGLVWSIDRIQAARARAGISLPAGCSSRPSQSIRP